jgi:hypothetical protein
MAIRTDRSVFYHIPKTGGMWVEEAMRASGLACTPCREISRHPWCLVGRHATPDGVAAADRTGFSFTFVRHPLGWYRSFWAYRVMLANFSPADDGAVFPPDLCWVESGDRATMFEQFVQRCLDMHPEGWVTSLYQCYLGLDYVGRQEHLVDELVEALRRAGETFDEAALRATPRRNRAATMPRFQDQLALSAETVERVLDCERWVIERYYDHRRKVCHT